MKTITILTGTLAGTLLLTGVACTKVQTRDVVATRDYEKEGILVKKGNKFLLSTLIIDHALSIAPLKEEFIPPCSTVGGPPNATRMVKLRINNNFDVKNTDRDVVSKSPSGGGVKPVPEPTPTLKSTTYDLKLDKTVWDAKAQIIAVKIILKDKDMRFLDDDHSVTTVASTAPETSMFKCLSPIDYTVEDKKDTDAEDNSDTGKDKYSAVTFFVAESNRRIQKFNIRLVVIQKKYPYVLPIILDPEIENTGFN